MNQIETLIFQNLLSWEAYTRKSIPYIQTEYFQDRDGQILFEVIDQFFNKYNAIPTPENEKCMETLRHVNRKLFE